MYSLAGPPGCGKSTQVDLLKQQGYGATSAGGLLREHASEEVIKQMLRGELADHNYTNSLIGQALDLLLESHGNQRIILDGYPRAVEQARWLLEDYQANLEAYLLLVASDQCLIGRLTNRQRVDDQTGVITRRIEVYKKNIKPLLNYYQQHGIPVYEINAEQGVEAIFNDVRKVLKLA